MDESEPDYQQVGKMFVFKYYTTMHKEPTQMHMFYHENSTFVHGGAQMGSGEAITGIQAIHEKIMSLNPQDVHTKIRQVDSHKSISTELGASIVIQVTGELTMEGDEMRPFVQTFVLVPQAHKRYYVYNDIFRYQLYDEYFDEHTDNGPVADDTAKTEPPYERPLSKGTHSPSIPDEVPYHTNEPTLPSGVTADMGSNPRSPMPIDGTTHSDVGRENLSGAWCNDQFGDPPSNGLPEEAQLSLGDEPTFPLHNEENTTPNETDITNVVTKELTPPVENKPHPSSSTWASRISQNIKPSTTPNYYPANSGNVSNNNTSKTVQPKQTQPLPQRDPKPVKKVEQRPIDKKPYQPNTQVMTSRTAPDSHQIFVGGLPPNTTENDLREVFSQFGKVLEVRVNPKNFGFIVFDGDQSVREIMSTKEESPVFLRDKRLNIEEKRQTVSKGSGGGFNNMTRRVQNPLRPVNRPQRRN